MLASAPAKTLKRTHGTGCYNPMIILDDVDVTMRSAGHVGSFFHQGQSASIRGASSCSEKIAGEFLENSVARTKTLAGSGDPQDPRT